MIFGEFQNQIARVAKTLYPLSSSTVVKSKLISYPEGVEDKEVVSKDFEIVEVDVKRTRKSEIKRTERINVKKLAYTKTTASPEDNEIAVDEDSNDSEEENEEE